MSMTTFMIWQMIGIFCAYFGVTLILPMVVFRRILKSKSITNQILFSFLIGNSYIITMVQILQLLKISHTITLILATFVPAYIVWVKLNNVKVKEVVGEFGNHVKRVTEKYMGRKTAAIRIKNKFRRDGRRFFRELKRLLWVNGLDVLLQIILLVLLIWVYGAGIISTYGYAASDIPVHNYWINAMGDNNIFVAGVYPHGYHCMIYYLHEVFGIETYLLLSLFAFVQVVCLYFGLLYFLKCCCKVPYVAYIGVFLFVVGAFFRQSTFSRFVCTLPQEFGMIFILPCIYYGFEFFKLRYEELARGEKKKESWYSLFGFAMGFGITLSAHFYNTIIAGLFCVAMAIGYIFLFVKKGYFWNIVVTCFVSVIVAILPMVIAFATGTKLQGSLYWATNIISESSSSSETADVSPGAGDSTQVIMPESNTNVNGNTTENVVIENQSTPTENIQKVEAPKEKKKKTLDIKKKFKTINNVMRTDLWEEALGGGTSVFWLMILLLFLAGVIYLLFKQVCYGAQLMTVAIYMVIMAILLASKQVGIISLMDTSRASIYLAYMCPVLLVMVLDAVIYALARENSHSKAVGMIVMALLLVSISGLGIVNKLRLPYSATGLESNEAITCLTNILHNEKNFSWTICSANDELRMCEEYGYHYEIITMLHEMENWDKEKTIIIPTEKIYFFIEKVPLNYLESYENSGQSISEKGAERPLSKSKGLAPYKGENRWITMSKMYYWAQEFNRMYPNEMKVYMETDNFVCYVLEQNTYDLYNLAIDYGYNTR